jgi:hypothetical protein
MIEEEMGNDAGELAVPRSGTPTQFGSLTVGATVRNRKQIRLIRPRKWRTFMFRMSTPLLECPYCLCLVGALEAADEHLWRLHANNASDRAGKMDLLPMLTELQRQVDHLEEDLGINGENALSWYTKGQTHEYTDRRRRKLHWKRWR